MQSCRRCFKQIEIRKLVYFNIKDSHLQKLFTFTALFAHYNNAIVCFVIK